MILASLRDSDRYAALHPLLKELFTYLQEHDLKEVPAGRITLQDFYINVADAPLLKAQEQKLEVHRA